METEIVTLDRQKREQSAILSAMMADYIENGGTVTRVPKGQANACILKPLPLQIRREPIDNEMYERWGLATTPGKRIPKAKD